MMLDIAMLFINASWNGVMSFSAVPTSNTEEMINLNTIQSLFIAKALIPTLTSREVKSALVMTQSFLDMVRDESKAKTRVSNMMMGNLAEQLYLEVNQNHLIDLLTFDAQSQPREILKRLEMESEEEYKKRTLISKTF